MDLKNSEARILTYLRQVKNELKYSIQISRKLEMDYNYLLRILGMMKAKKWIRAVKPMGTNKTFYEACAAAPTKEECAKQLAK